MKKWIATLGLMALLVSFAKAQAGPDYTLTLSISDIKTFPNRIIAFVAVVTSVNNFTGDVTIIVTGLPVGWTVTPFPANGKLTLRPDLPRAIAFSVLVPSGVTPGTFTGTVKAESTNYN